MSNEHTRGLGGRRTRFHRAVIAVLAISCPAIADTIVFTTNTTISDTNFTYDGHDIVVEGCTVTINGAHLFNSLVVQRSAGNVAGVVTHTAGFDNGVVAGFELTTVGNVYIEGADGTLVASRVQANGKGYASGSGPGAGGAGTYGGGGGGYGGNGGAGKFGAGVSRTGR